MMVIVKMLQIPNNFQITMDTKALLKGSLQTISTVLIGTGATMLMGKDLYGLVLMGVGIGIQFYREYFKLQK